MRVLCKMSIVNILIIELGPYIVYCSEINKSVELSVREHNHILLS